MRQPTEEVRDEISEDRRRRGGQPCGVRTDEARAIKGDESSGGDPSRRLRASEVRALKVEDASGEVQGQRLGDARHEGQ